MGIAKFFMQATVAAFITMIFIYFIKKAVAGKNVPVLSTVADGV